MCSSLDGPPTGVFSTDEWRPEKYRNHYVDAVRELIKEKAKGHAIVTAEEPAAPRGTVINLMDALRKSIEGGKPTPAKAPATVKQSAPAAKKKTGTRR
jgi:DNA end-binding protein Ku